MEKQIEPQRLLPLGAGSACRRVVLLRALQLGDLLCAVPAFRALRAALPQSEIALIGLPWAREFVKRYSRFIDRFIEFPGYPGLPEREPLLSRIPAFLDEIQLEQFDLAIQMHGSGYIVNPLLVLLGADANAGYYVPGEYCPDPETFMPYPEGEPEVRRHLRLMEFLGVQSKGETLEFPLIDKDEEQLAGLPEAADLRRGSFAVIHPGARAHERRWTPERFAPVADALVEAGLQVVITGSVGEKDLAAAVLKAMQCPAVDLSGKTTLGALGVLVRDARLLVSNDTGVSHLAAALRVPSVVVFSASDPGRWAPLDRERHHVVDGKSQDQAAVIAEALALLREDAVHA